VLLELDWPWPWPMTSRGTKPESMTCLQVIAGRARPRCRIDRFGSMERHDFYEMQLPRSAHCQVQAEAKQCTERHDSYYNQSGWNEFEWAGRERVGFVCCDSVQTGLVQGAGDCLRTHPMEADVDFARDGQFAGLVCIEG
jgi:hypothetical protein